MKIMKAAAAVALSIILIIAGSMAMGIFSIDRALTEGNASEALRASSIGTDLCEEVLSENTVNNGGIYGEIIMACMETDAMNSFISSYIVTASRGEIYGEDYEEIGEEELMNAFTSAFEEVKDEGEIPVSAADEEVIKSMLIRFVPYMTEDINTNMDRFTSTRTVLAEDGDYEDIGSMLGWGVRLAVLLLCGGVMALLIFLFRGSGAGLLWCAADTGIVTLIYIAVTLMGPAVITASASGGDLFIAELITGGFKTMAVTGTIMTILFTAAYIFLRTGRRRDR